MKLFIISFFILLIYNSTYGGESKMKNENKDIQKNKINDSVKCDNPKSDADLKKILSPEQYRIVRENGTESPFKNAFWDNKHPGIYVDVVSGKPLFSSKDKFDSGTGWPSFTKPLESSEIVEKKDISLGVARTEVRSKSADSHLGHVFNDGPSETKMRYCINSASLKFIPLEELEQKGYLDELYSFEEDDYKKAGLKPVEYALFGGGCFWGVEELIRKLPGVISTQVGYAGGVLNQPKYENVKTGTTQHAEVVLVKYDPNQLTYESLLKYFFRLHDPTTLNQQGNDHGSQYRSVIFFFNDKQKNTAQVVKEKINNSKKWPRPVVTEITHGTKFWGAEDYHQKYLQKNPNGYTCHFLRPE